MHGRIALIVVAIGIAVLLGWRFLQPKLDASNQSEVSDVAGKERIVIAVDGWVGYFPLCSAQMKKQLLEDGYSLSCVDDLANYSERYRGLRSGAYDFAVGTVDAYLLNGEQFNFPGPIITVLDESKGGDAIVSRKSVIPTIEALKDSSEIKVAFTPDSPSHHLMKAISTHFDVEVLTNRDSWIQTDGSASALSALETGKADVAVLWEPDVSRALSNPEYVRLIGTESTDGLIVDILISAQNVVRDEPQKVLALLKAYFKTLVLFSKDEPAFLKGLKQHYSIDETTAKNLLKGVEWQGLSNNARRWFGVADRQRSSDALARAIYSAADILVDNGDFSATPVPSGDAYFLTNSSFIKQLFDLLESGQFVASDVGSNNNAIFSSLTNDQWSRLEKLASLKARKIQFSSGDSKLTPDDKRAIDSVIQDLEHYPAFRVEIRGHTGLRGEAEENIQLSKTRANSVLEYVLSQYDIDKNRIRAVGLGSSEPLKKLSGESNRAYRYRLPRVEIVLLGEAI